MNSQVENPFKSIIKAINCARDEEQMRARVTPMLRGHAPIHDTATASPKAWRAICPHLDRWHVMAGPIVNNGQLIGSLGCTREKSPSSFNNRQLVIALCSSPKHSNREFAYLHGVRKLLL